ncbi:MAG: copper ion binding protein, partial [Halobacteriaceae archaeon]
MSHRRSQLAIQGMSCANCSQTITDALEKKTGIFEANINFATDEGLIEYDPDVVSLAEIYETIENAGYNPERVSLSIGISDMSCANCAETIESALGSIPGVITAEVNYAIDEAQVEYNTTAVSQEQLYERIEEAGYTPIRDEGNEEQSDQERRDVARQAEIRKQLRLTIFGGILSIPLLFFLVDHYLLSGAITPASIHGIQFGWIEFLLATPIQIVLGWQFYENSYKALIKNNRANMDVLIALGSSTAYLYSV